MPGSRYPGTVEGSFGEAAIMPEADSGPEPKPEPRLGSYLLVQALGSGGMSNVFRAVHEESGNVVAVKVLPRTLAKNATLLQRFMREAKSAEALDHPNVVAIYDRGFDQGRHYLVLEYVEGRDMHDRVRLSGPLAPDEAAHFIREVAEGLRYASAQGMIHRDVKPANLLMTPDGHAKIIDLGLALLIEDEDERVTRDGTTVGTVDYMAPEQARDSRQTSERSDIYSLGCTFYYLLTGSAPFPGGGLSDKLARHYKAPIPDVREHRTDVSESLSFLIRKMMEKKPERRFADYSELIEALDTLDNPPTQDMPGEAMDALIVDDDDDDDNAEFGLAQTETSMGRRRDERPPSSKEEFLMAEIVDDDDDDDDKPVPPTLPPPGPRPRGREASPSRTKPATPAAPAELSLAELAELHADDSPAVRRPAQKSSPATPTVRPSAKPAQPANRSPSASFPVIPDEDDEEEVVGSEGAMRPSIGSEVPLKTWISAGVMVGLLIAIFGFGASMLLPSKETEAPPETIVKPIEEASSDGTYAPTPTRRPDGPREREVARKKELEKKAAETPPPVVAAGPQPEATYQADWESKLAPPPSNRPVLPADSKARTVVRRVAQAGEETQFASIASAFGRANDLIEIADVGPFFEDDCQIAGKSRLIRARGGVRPMIKVEYGKNEIVKEQAAKFVLGGARVDHLVLEGIDFAINVRDLPVHQSTLFLCQGVDLTLRDCSLTILNANDPSRTSRFSIFRVEEGAKPNRIVLERTFIRGPVGTLIDIAGSRAEVVFSRSLILGDSRPLIVAEAVDKPIRSFHFYRSILATRGPLLDFTGRPNHAPVIRSLGTLFAKVEGGNSQAVGLFSSRASFAGEPPAVLDWAGEDNEFVGWPGWLTAGSDASVRVTGLSGIKTAWPGSDETSRESPSPWPAPNQPDEIRPFEVAQIAPHREATLLKIAAPPARLRELTFGSLAKLVTPELSPTLVSAYVPPVVKPATPTPAPTPPPAPSPKPNIKAPPEPPTGPRPKNKAANKGGPVMQGGVSVPQPPGPLTLVFDVREAPWQGDLGRFLTEKLVVGTPKATITVKGTGVHAISPIRFADGLSIAILGESTVGSNVPMLTFVPNSEGAGRAMFELHGGDLAIANLGFSSEKATRPKNWVLSEDGILAIRHCWFREPNTGGSAPATGPVVSFVAKGTAPIAPRVGPLVKETDRPTARLKDCLIWTTGEAVSAEVGRGVIDLENCMVISGGPAFTLLPRDVARDMFEADLVLDRCTIAVDKTAVLLGPLTGVPLGPSRPWLVSTRRCAFPRTQAERGAGALLQVDPDAMARGLLFWQSSFDAYDSLRLLASTGPQPANIPSADVKKQWIDIWGAEHAKGDQGPIAGRNETVLRYKDRDKPKPGKVVPSALEVDKEVTDHGVDFKDIPTVTKVLVEAPSTRKAGTLGPTGKGAFGPRQDRP
jgi:eukaryotic-like serine/threonine-protein kinase